MSPQALRRLCPLELYSSTRHHMGIYRAVVVSSRHTLPTSQDPTSYDDPVLFAALERLVLKHPALRVGILGQDTNEATYSHITRLDLLQHVEFRTVKSRAGSSDYDAYVSGVHAHCHNQLWPDLETRAPWKLIIVQPDVQDVEADAEPEPAVEDFVLAFHHSLMDGIAGKEFHEQLLRALNDLAQDKSLPAQPRHVLEFPEPPVLPEGQDDVVDFSFTAGFAVSTVWDEYGPSWLKPKPDPLWSGTPVNLRQPHNAQVRILTIPGSVVGALVAACRRHGASLTSLLHALTLASWARRVPCEAEAAVPSFIASTPINLRPWVNPAKANPALRDSFRILVANTLHHFPSNAVAQLRAGHGSAGSDLDALIWHHAQQIKSKIRQSVEALPADDRAHLLKFVPDLFAFWRKKDGHPRDQSWGLSNLGTSSPNTDGDDQESSLSQPPSSRRLMSRMAFTNSIMLAGSPIGLNVASVAGGPMTMGMSWNHDALPDDMASGLADDLLAWTTNFHDMGRFVAAAAAE